ncbi:hypothetical protein, partial [Vibrio cholerae]|uniref:hypothetical protein n=1 Tax=Vibrio cholerae TaxID=666 RepID=UPI0018E0AC54
MGGAAGCGQREALRGAAISGDFGGESLGVLRSVADVDGVFAAGHDVSVLLARILCAVGYHPTLF